MRSFRKNKTLAKNSEFTEASASEIQGLIMQSTQPAVDPIKTNENKKSKNVCIVEEKCRREIKAMEGSHVLDCVASTTLIIKYA